MEAKAVFSDASERAGLYESFFVRAVSPDEPIGVWIRYTVQKAPGQWPTGAVWCTIFDARLGGPFMHKATFDEVRAPEGVWLGVGDATIRAGTADGSSGDARWSLRFHPIGPDLHHLRPDWLYRAPLPRTKLTSPAPLASFDGVVTVAGRDPIELRGWPGMAGHNWGSEHAERWIWLHGVAFDQDETAWLDVAIGRLRVGRWLSPWVANGAVSIAGRRYRLGGLGARGLRVSESTSACEVHIRGRSGLTLVARASVPDGSGASWRYADPDGRGHDVMNCSVARLELEVQPSKRSLPLTLTSPHGGVYELGTLEAGRPVRSSGGQR